MSVRTHISETTYQNFTKVSLPADHGRWRRCDMLSTSGFVDHAVLAHSGQEINIGDAKMTYGQSDSAVEI